METGRTFVAKGIEDTVLVDARKTYIDRDGLVEKGIKYSGPGWYAIGRNKAGQEVKYLELILEPNEINASNEVDQGLMKIIYSKLGILKG